MSLNRTLRSPQFDQPRRWLWMVIVCTCVWIAHVPSADASILLPAAPEFKLEDCGANDMGSGADQAAEQADDADRSESHILLASTDAAPGSSSSGSSSPAGGFGSTPVSAIDALVCSVPLDLQLMGWVTGSTRFSLPMPPGTDLLRPPQDS